MEGIFDSHAHYDAEQFDEDRDVLLGRLPSLGVVGVVNAASNLAYSRTSIALAERYPYVYAAVGIHPEEAGALTDEDLRELRRLYAHPKVVAIGEIGAGLPLRGRLSPGRPAGSLPAADGAGGSAGRAGHRARPGGA